MDVLCFDWLQDGALPVYEVRGPFWYAGLTDAGAWEWRHAPGRARMILPLEESRLEDFLVFLRQPLPEGRSLVLSLRSSYKLALTEGEEPVHYVCLGVGITDELVEGTPWGDVPDLEEAFQALLRFTTQDEPPAEPWLQVAWARYRDERTRQRRILDACAQEEPPEEEWLRVHWERAQVYRAEDKRVGAAKARAKQLLLGCLNEEQTAELEAHDRFRVRGSDGFVYLITNRSHLGVWRLDAEGEKTHNVCIVVDAAVPVYDQMLAQKLLLEADLQAFLETAHVRAIGADGRLIAAPTD